MFDEELKRLYRSNDINNALKMQNWKWRVIRMDRKRITKVVFDEKSENREKKGLRT